MSNSPSRVVMPGRAASAAAILMVSRMLPSARVVLRVDGVGCRCRALRLSRLNADGRAALCDGALPSPAGGGVRLGLRL